MNLVDQIFEQAKLGTAPDINANPFLEGRRVGIAQQHADIAKQQLAMELAQAPLQQTLLQQRADMGALAIERGLLENQSAIEGHSLLAQYSKAMQGANLLPLESGLRVHSQFGLDHPAILNTPEYQQAGKQLDARVRQASIEEERLSIAEARMATAAAAQSRAEAARLKAKLEEKDKADLAPRLVDLGGVPHVYNPGTKKLERLDKTESKAAFIEKRALQYSKDNMITPKEAAEQLGKLYDEQIAPLTAGFRGTTPPQAVTTAPPPVPPASVPTAKDQVIVRDRNGKRFWIPSNELERAVKQGYIAE